MVAVMSASNSTLRRMNLKHKVRRRSGDGDSSSSEQVIKIRKTATNSGVVTSVDPVRLSTRRTCFSNPNPSCENADQNVNNRFGRLYFMKPCIDLAKCLLGKILVRMLPNGEVLKGRIVETECYLGVEDKACHSYKGKVTGRNAAMFMKPGTAYVYSIYGMYFCFNISSLEEGSAVLIRSLEPLVGLATMRTLRSARRNSAEIKERDLCNGPSKLCQALDIQKDLLNKEDLTSSDRLWIEHGTDIDPSHIVTCKRIGIDSAGEEWANKPLRFYIYDCQYVSVRNREAEKNVTLARFFRQMLYDGSNCSRGNAHATMKQPRLPGTEKFKFSSPAGITSPSGPLLRNSTSQSNQQSSPSEFSNAENSASPKPSILHARSPSRYSQNELSPLTCTMSVPSLHRSDSRRRAVLPITCKKTSRMLNNTNLELNVDHAELISEDDVKNGRLHHDNSRVPSCPNLESSRSLNSSKTSLDAYFRKLSLQNPPIREAPHVDWMNIRASPSRLSASCSSSCSSEENVWVLREDA